MFRPPCQFGSAHFVRSLPLVLKKPIPLWQSSLRSSRCFNPCARFARLGNTLPRKLGRNTIHPQKLPLVVPPDGSTCYTVSVLSIAATSHQSAAPSAQLRGSFLAVRTSAPVATRLDSTTQTLPVCPRPPCLSRYRGNSTTDAPRSSPTATLPRELNRNPSGLSPSVHSVPTFTQDACASRNDSTTQLFQSKPQPRRTRNRTPQAQVTINRDQLPDFT